MHSFQSLIILPSTKKVEPSYSKETNKTITNPNTTFLLRREKKKTVMSKRSTPSKTPSSSSKSKDKVNAKTSMTTTKTTKNIFKSHSNSGTIISGGIKEVLMPNHRKPSSLEIKEIKNIAGNPISDKLEKSSRSKSSTISSSSKIVEKSLTKSGNISPSLINIKKHQLPNVKKSSSLSTKTSKTLSNASQFPSLKPKTIPIQQLSQPQRPQQLSQLMVNSFQKSEMNKPSNILESYCDVDNELDEFVYEDIFLEKNEIKSSSIGSKKSESINLSNNNNLEKNNSSNISSVYLEKDDFDDFDDLSISPKKVTSIFSEKVKDNNELVFQNLSNSVDLNDRRERKDSVSSADSKFNNSIKNKRVKPQLIRNLNSEKGPKVVGEMVYNPILQRWDGNESILKDFYSSTTPNISQPTKSLQSVGNMVFDPIKLRWFNPVSTEEEILTLSDSESETTKPFGSEFEVSKGFLAALMASERQHRKDINHWYPAIRSISNEQRFGLDNNSKKGFLYEIRKSVRENNSTTLKTSRKGNLSSNHDKSGSSSSTASSRCHERPHFR
ncbi:3723_t:CDS:2 [Diversispora eburnea]|uniref:3723_t:CDS:1 n=1 Tax=Diversispora eburnea TaxID=1213867 RepID=A0A9N9FB67_9GLOM|nr:3723_t:CDS:2 [Diversispora eburnea]